MVFSLFRRRRPDRRTVKLHLEHLEDRLTPYVASGGAWVNPQLITISFVPDGTVLGVNALGQQITSTLFNDFNSLFGSPSVWEPQIIKAAQAWAQQTNINFSIISDNGAASGTGSYEQGDPNMGDIRIAGFQEGTLGVLATTFMPPQLNNYSIAGDMTFNTQQTYNIGTTYDLYTVAMHEFGHALGLSDSLNPNAVMFGVYTSTFTSLNSDDVAGIRSIYSSGNARSPDQYNTGTSDSTFATATSVTVSSTTDTALVTGADISTAGQSEYFEFTAPTGSASTATINVQSTGLSLLAPKVYVYNAAHAQIAYETGLGQYGTTLTVTPSITAGSTYYIKVTGADTSAMGTGNYAITINTGTGASPTVPLPNTQVADGNPEVTGGGQFDLTGPSQALNVSTLPTTTVANNLASVANNLASHGGAFNQQMVIGPNMASKDLAFQGMGSTVSQSSRSLVWVESGSDADDASSDSDGTIWAGEELALPTWFAV